MKDQSQNNENQRSGIENPMFDKAHGNSKKSDSCNSNNTWNNSNTASDRLIDKKGQK